MVKNKSFISSPEDTLKDAKKFDKQDKDNNDRKQKLPELSTNPKLNKVGLKKLIIPKSK